MRFLSIYSSKEASAPPNPELIAAMGKLVEESIRDGSLISTEGCLPSAMGARVRQADGRVTVTDGPFTEAKEVVGGFAILRANSKEEAIEMARKFLRIAGDGECEIRQIAEYGEGDCGPELTGDVAQGQFTHGSAA